MKYIRFILLLLFTKFSFAQDLKQVKETISLDNQAFSLAFNNKFARLFIGGADGQVEVFDLDKASILDSYSFEGRINQLKFDKSENHLALCTAKGLLLVWRLPDFIPVVTLNMNDYLQEDTPENNKTYLQEIVTLVWCKNNQELFFAGNSGIIYRININRPKDVEEWINLKRKDVIPKITDLALTPDGSTLLVCAGKIIGVPLHAPENHKELFDLDVKDFSTLAVYPSARGHQLVAWSYFSKQIYFWEDYRFKDTYKTRKLSRQPFASRMKFLDENLVISGTQDSGIVIFDLKKDSILQYRNDHTDKVLAIEISKDKQYVCSGGYDKKLNIYKVAYQKASDTNNIRLAASTYEILKSIKHLWFLDNSHKYRDTSLAKNEIQKLYDIYQRDTSLYILLNGYTNQGKDIEDLQRLSELRANKVKYDLVKIGIPPNKIRAKGRGPRKLSPQDIQDGRINMRVEIDLMSQDALNDKLMKSKNINAKVE